MIKSENLNHPIMGKQVQAGAGGQMKKRGAVRHPLAEKTGGEPSRQVRT